MSGIVADLLIDTDVFIDHLRGARRLEPRRDRLCYSVVTRCELYAGTTTVEETIDRLLAPFTEIPVDRSIAEHAGRIRRWNGTRIADALIAATAMEHDLTLVTRNIRDFRNLTGLRVQTPG